MLAIEAYNNIAGFLIENSHRSAEHFKSFIMEEIFKKYRFKYHIL